MFWSASVFKGGAAWRFSAEPQTILNAFEGIAPAKAEEADFTLRADVGEEPFDPATFDPGASLRRNLRIVCPDRNGIWRSIGVDREGVHRGSVAAGKISTWLGQWLDETKHSARHDKLFRRRIGDLHVRHDLKFEDFEFSGPARMKQAGHALFGSTRVSVPGSTRLL